MNGEKFKELFDCERGIMGSFFSANDAISKALQHVVSPNDVKLDVYLKLCHSITEKWPYLSER